MQQIFLSPYSIINTGHIVGTIINATSEDKVACVVPLHCSAGLSLGFPLTLSLKARLDVLGEVFDAETLPNMLSTHKSSVLVIQPSQLEELLPYIPEGGKSKSIDLSSLKTIVIASSPGNTASTELLQSLSSTLGKNISVYVTFGTNETAGVISITKANQFGQNFVGNALPHTEVAVLDVNMKPVPSGTTGILFVKGFNILQGFKGHPALAQLKIRNGWLNTGVSAVLKPEGLYLA